MRMRLRSPLAASMIALLIAAGCGDDGDAGAGADTPTTGGTAVATSTTAAPRRGGIVTWTVASETAGLDPVVSAGSGTNGGTELAAIYDTLMRYNPVAKTYEPRTAASLEPNAASTVWTLKLKPGIKFSDGTAYDADAVVYSMKRHTQFASRSASLLATISSYQVADPLTVVFTLSSPWVGFPYVLSHMPGMIVSKTAVEAACKGVARAADCSFNTKPVGAGPFVLDSYKVKESLALKRNDTYYGGPSYLDGITFVPAAGGPSGVYDSIGAGSSTGGIIRDAAVAKAATTEGKVGTYQNLAWGGGTYMFNVGQVMCRNGQPASKCAGAPDGVLALPVPTADKTVRQAIAAAVDVNVVVQRAYSGAAGVGSTKIFQEGSQYAGPETTKYDLTKAKQLVAEAKGKGWNGRLRLVCTTTSRHQAIGLAFVTMMSAVGVQVDAEYIDNPALVQKVFTAKDYEVACAGMGIAEEEPSSTLSNYLHCCNGGFNMNSPAWDAELDGVRATTGAQRKTHLDNLAKLWAEDVPGVIFEATPEVLAWQPKLNGVTPTVATIAHFEKAWLAS